MKDMLDLKATQIRIYQVDVVPLPSLVLEKNFAVFKDSLRFKGATLGDEPSQAINLVFLNGEIEHKGTIHLVERLAIEPRRIVLSVFGPSAAADTLYEEVKKILIAADPTGVFAKAEPYVKTEETTCAVTLNVDFRKLFAPPLLRFLERTVRYRTSTKVATSEVVPSRFSARISYELIDPNLKKVGIEIVDKVLTIEPRARTRLEERRYYTHSPTDSDTHLDLLKEFEKAFGGAPPSRRRSSKK